ncbi:MAG: hypothetical protein IT176_02025 [Acidobacteria bacterium]|nr:hypothetical protein [Acidobacteriota bacterium]
MTRVSRTAAAALLAMGTAGAPAMAQAPAGVQNGVKLGKVYLSGENPVIRLLDKEGGTPVVVASFWRVIWSPAGAGHVCLLTTGNGASPDDLRIALVDNEKLFEFLTRDVLGSYDKTYAERPFTVMPATFGSSGNTATEWKESCRSDRYAVELAWRDLYPPFQLDTPAGGSPNPFGVTSLFIPARSADVILNGKRLAGNVYPQMRGPAQSSTAFLAFSESWIK